MSTESVYIKIQQEGGELVAKTIKDIGEESATTDKRTKILTKDLDRQSTSMKQTAGAGNLLKSALGAIGATYLAKEIFTLADSLQTMQNKLKVVTNGTEELKTVQSALFGVAKSSKSEIESVVDLYSRMARSTEALGLSQSETIGLTETISKALQVSGASTQEASSAVLQLGQALGSGALRGEEFNAVNEASPVLMQALADSLGVARGELKNMASQGKLTSEIVIKAFQEQSNSIESQFNKMDTTVGQALTNIKTNFLESFASFDDATGLSSGLANVLSFIGDNIGGLIKGVAILGVAIGGQLAGNLLKATSLTGGFGGSLTSVFNIIKTNPIGIIITALGGLYSIIGQNSQALEAMKNGFGKIFSLISDGVDSTISAMLSIGQSLHLLPEKVNSITSSFGGLYNFIQDGAQALPFFFYAVFKDMQTAGQNFVSNLIAGFQLMWLNIKKVALYIQDGFLSAFQSIIDGYNSTIGAISDSVKIDVDLTQGVDEKIASINGQISNTYKELDRIKNARLFDSEKAKIKFIIDTQPIEKATNEINNLNDKKLNIQINVKDQLVKKQVDDLLSDLDSKIDLFKAKQSGDDFKVFTLQNNIDTSKFDDSQLSSLKTKFEYYKKLSEETDVLSGKTNELASANDTLGVSVDGFNAKAIEQMGNVDIMTNSINNFGNGLSDAITGFLTGQQSFSEAFGNMATSFVSDMVAMTTKMLIFKGLSSIFENFGSSSQTGLAQATQGMGAFAQSMTANTAKVVASSQAQSTAQAIQGATTSASSTGAASFFTMPTFIASALATVLGAFASIPSFATGGAIYGAGTGTSDSIMAKVSNGEYIMKADTVSKLGVGFLDRLNQSGSIPAFATGGMITTNRVNNSTISNNTTNNVADNNSADRGNNQNIKVVVVMNDEQIISALADSSNFERVIVQKVKANKQDINA